MASSQLSKQGSDFYIGVAVIIATLVGITFFFDFVFAFKCVLLFVATWLYGLLVIYLWGRQSVLAKLVAVILLSNVLFLLFLPNSLKEQLNLLKKAEQNA